MRYFRRQCYEQCRRWFLLVALFAWWTNSAWAHEVTIQSLSLTNFTGYIIASDQDASNPSYNRDAFHLVAQVHYSTKSSKATAYAYRLRFRLLNAMGDPVLIYDETGKPSEAYWYDAGEVTLPIELVWPPITLFFYDATYQVDLRPAQRLSPYEQYYVELSVYENPVDGGRWTVKDHATTSLFTVYHFPSRDPADPQVNVIAVLDDVQIERTYCIPTVSGKDAFTARVQYTLHRYDKWDQNPEQSPVVVRFQLELREAGGTNSVPLEQAIVTVTNQVWTHTIAVVPNPIAPVKQTFEVTVPFRPLEQLDSPNQEYELAVRISHIEEPPEKIEVGNQVISSAARLLHFNGKLLFGGIETEFDALLNDPVPISIGPQGIATTLQIPSGHGWISGNTGYRFGDGTALPVWLESDGDAVYRGSGDVAVTHTMPDLGVTSGVRYARSNLRLNTSGLFGDVTVWLPTGLGCRTNLNSRVIQGRLTFQDVGFSQSVTPLDSPGLEQPMWIAEESKPLWIEAEAVRWEVSQGRFRFQPTGKVRYVRWEEIDFLRNGADVLDASMREKKGNDLLFMSAEEVVSEAVIAEVGANGAAEMTYELRLGKNVFQAHFPYGVKVSILEGRVVIQEDRIQPRDSFVTVTDPIVVSYARDCVGANCGGSAGPATLEFEPTDQTLHVTPDGGLVGEGTIVNPQPLTWGWIQSKGEFAHQVEAFEEGRFHMPGCFVRGIEQALPPKWGGVTILYSGVDPQDLEKIERPGTSGYQEGLGDYAGLNFRVGSDGNKSAQSVLGGEPTGSYPLTGRSKYYVRLSGVSGIHEAVYGSFPKEAKIYGYQFQFDNFGLAFLDNQNVDSRTQGSVYVPSPSDFTQRFERLRFSCLGALEKADVPSDEAGLTKVLKYWQADFVTLAIAFARPASVQCDPGKGYLTLGVEAYAPALGESVRLYGTLGFHPNGNLITREDGVLDPPFDSRLKVPSVCSIPGPKDEKYAFTPVIDAYLNNWDYAHGSGEQGFLNVAGRLDVPFFEDLWVHIHTTPDKEGTNAPLYMMGGWRAGKGFEEPSGIHFFNQTTNQIADPDNRGFPSGVTLAEYREGDTGGNEEYLVRAYRTWLEVIDFEYPLKWSTSSRSFQSFKSEKNDLLVLTVEHQVRYLSAEHAELRFGAQYEGLPQINLANLAYDQLDGVGDVIQNVLGQASRQAIDEGLDSLNELLSDQIHELMDPVLDSMIDPVIDNLYTQLQSDFQSFGGSPSSWNPDPLIDQYFTGPVGSIQDRLQQLVNGAAGSTTNLLQDIDGHLAKAQQMVGIFRDLLKKDSNGHRNLVANLTKALVGEFAADLVSLLTDEWMDSALERADSTLDAIYETLDQLYQTIGMIRNELQAGGQIAQELQQKWNAHLAELNQIAQDARDTVKDWFHSVLQQGEDPFTYYTADEIKQMIRQEIEDRLMGSVLSTVIQETVKQWMYDVDAMITEAIGSIFQEVNTMIRDALSQALASVDDTINGFLGKVNSVMGAGRVNGYAKINGDALRELRLDIYAKLSVASDFELNAYLLIKELDSEGTPSVCLPGSGKATEVEMGAKDVEVKWISKGVKASVQAKFTFDTGGAVPIPINCMGGIELKGTINFEAVKIKYMGASMAFGELENYLSCATKLAINKYEGAGGVFFGRTCTLDPFFWDKDVQSILGNPPFTGAYIYVEVWVPLSETLLGIPATCMFQISAGIGMGVGYFMEGPTFIGKMLVGANGEVLCIVSVEGKIVLVGVKNSDGVHMKGHGDLTGKIGCCPFCIKFSKTLGLEYKEGSWSVDF